MSDLVRKTRFLPTLAGLCLALLAPAGVRAEDGLGAPEVRQTLNVRYHEGRGRQLLDVFAPPDAEKAPVVLFVHGGTWMYGDKNFFGQYRKLGRFLARNGVVAVLINYRLSPKVKHPEHVKDVARAFAWTVKNVEKYGGDPRTVFLCGHSAGGHLVALLATDASYLEDPSLKLTPEERAAVKGVIGVSGVYRIPGPDEFRVMLQHIVNHWVQSGTPAWLAKPLLKAGEGLNPFRLVFGEGRDVQVSASPLSHVRKGLPPFLLLYAEAEVPGLIDMAHDFQKALRKVGVRVDLKSIPDCTHRTILFRVNRPRDPAGRALMAFIGRHAGKGA
jgi:acetyl esterase/lipase